MRKPDFFMVGAPKSGTTAMHAYLAQHPEIYMPRREMHFFASDLHAAYYVRDEGTYLSWFSGALGKTRVGERSVWYLFSRRAAEEIKRYCPAAKIIVMLRNPVDVMYAMHSQQIWSRCEDIADFSEALGAEEDRKRGKRVPPGCPLVHGLFYRDIARFTEQLQRYLAAFDRPNVHIIIYDDLVENAGQVFRDACAFLGVRQDFVPSLLVVNANKRVRWDAIDGWIKYPPQWSRKIGRLLLPQGPRIGLRERLRRWNSVEVSRPPLDARLRRVLQEEFRPEVERLSMLLERDLTPWSLVGSEGKG